jgi:hypothetical protein
MRLTRNGYGGLLTAGLLRPKRNIRRDHVDLQLRAAGRSLSVFPVTEPPSVTDVAYWHETDMPPQSLAGKVN